MVEPTFLTLEDILLVHREQIRTYGGSPGVRDLALLQSAIAQPQATFSGKYLHSDLFEMAAAYLLHLTQNHPFIDGNKRVGLEAALVFLAINGVDIEAEDDKLEMLVMDTAQGKKNKSQIAAFLRANAQ